MIYNRHARELAKGRALSPSGVVRGRRAVMAVVAVGRRRAALVRYPNWWVGGKFWQLSIRAGLALHEGLVGCCLVCDGGWLVCGGWFVVRMV